MTDFEGPHIAVVDFDLGNLFSVQRACEYVGLNAIITSSPEDVAAADGVVLPGVGAYGDAVATLRRTGLGDAVVDAAAREVPVLGVCLGMQLLLGESHEFGRHEGLGLIAGDVLPLRDAPGLSPRARVPHMGWSRVDPGRGVDWSETPLADVHPGTHLYFVHSFYAAPRDQSLIVSTTDYAGATFCSSFRSGSVFACQFHPERSGRVGLSIYRRAFESLLAREPEGVL